MDVYLGTAAAAAAATTNLGKTTGRPQAGRGRCRRNILHHPTRRKAPRSAPPRAATTSRAFRTRRWRCEAKRQRVKCFCHTWFTARCLCEAGYTTYWRHHSYAVCTVGYEQRSAADISVITTRHTSPRHPRHLPAHCLLPGKSTPTYVHWRW